MRNYEINKIAFSEGIKTFPIETQNRILHDVKNVGNPLYIYYDKEKPEQKYLLSERSNNSFATHNILDNGLYYGHYENNSFEHAENDIAHKIDLQNGFYDNDFTKSITDISKTKTINDFTMDEKIPIILNITEITEQFPQINEYWDYLHPRHKDHKFEVQPYLIKEMFENNPDEFNLNNEAINNIIKKSKNNPFFKDLIKDKFKQQTQKEEEFSLDYKTLVSYKNEPGTKFEEGFTSLDEAAHFIEYQKDINKLNYSVMFDFSKDNIEIINSTNKYGEKIKVIDFLNKNNNITDNIPYFDNFKNKEEMQLRLNKIFVDMAKNNHIPAYNIKENSFLIIDKETKSIKKDLTFNQILKDGIEIIEKNNPSDEQRIDLKIIKELSKKNLSEKSKNNKTVKDKEIDRLKEELKKAQKEIKNLRNFNETLSKVMKRDNQIFQGHKLAEIFKNLEKNEINECWKKTQIFADSIRKSKEETKSNINLNEKSENTGNSGKRSR